MAGQAWHLLSLRLFSFRGFYLRLSFINPASQLSLIDDSYPYYKGLQTLTFGIGPHSTAVKTFEGQKNQKFSLTLNVEDANAVSQPQSSSLFRTVVNVTDAGGSQLLFDNNVGRTYSMQPIQIRNNGTVSVALTNQEDKPISVTMYLRQSSPPPSAFGAINDSLITFSNWLMTISAPIFALGIWLLISERRKNGSAETPKSNPIQS